MTNYWKTNWPETQQHYRDWWQHKGTILSTCYMPVPIAIPHEAVPDPGPERSRERFWLDVEYRARRTHYDLAHSSFVADILPHANCDIGPGNLATFLGSDPVVEPDTIWFTPCYEDIHQTPTLTFDPQNKWWKKQVEVIQAIQAQSQGRYFTACPDLIENVDTLASLRGTENILMDLAIHGDWVKRKVAEINQVYFQAYEKIYDLIKLPDGSSAYSAYRLWAPGRVIKVQCDASAMFSPNMFAEFVLPGLKEQCDWIDYSIYHLDGTQALCHLDHLLRIDSLDAIEWTPEPKVPHGSDPHWYDLYQKILDAGKSIQAVDVRKSEVLPMLKRFGNNGIYFSVSDLQNQQELIDLEKAVHKYR